jgi:hypothetical protein
MGAVPVLSDSSYSAKKAQLKKLRPLRDAMHGNLSVTSKR